MGSSTPRRRDFSSQEHQIWMEGIFDIYRRMRERHTPYVTRVCGIDIIVHSDVYAPDFFTDTEWFATALSGVVGTNRLLEIGTGTGAISLVCARNGATVVATDINPAAVANARDNFARHNLDVDVRLGNLYEPLRPDESFDYIFWAHPFNNWPEAVNDNLLMSGLDCGYVGTKGYFDFAHRHLAPGGRLLLGTGDSADLETILTKSTHSNYSARTIRRETMPLEYTGGPTITYYLIEFTLRGHVR